GPAAVFDDELQELMGWAPLTIDLCANNLTVTYKGVEVFNEVVEYDPSPGRLVFGGRTGGSNAYHHIDNIVIKTDADVGAGCTVIPPSFVGGENTIGTREFEGAQSNHVFGPFADNISGWSVTMVDTDLTVDSQTIADDIIDAQDGIVSTGFGPQEDDTAAYDVIDLAGGGGNFGVNHPYPNGVNDDSLDNFAVQAVANVVIPAGTWTIGFGSDDGGKILIPGVEFIDSQANDNFQDDEIRFEAPRGHAWTVGTFELTEPLETAVLASFYEAGGGDSFEVAIKEGAFVEDADPNNGWELLGDGTLGWSVKTSGSPLVSADLSATVVSERPLQFDVNGDTGEADQLAIPNPIPGTYRTVLDVDGITFQIAPTGAVANGDAFRIIDADVITGTPLITSLDGQSWVFDSATGRVCLGSCPGAGTLGDFNGDGSVTTADLDVMVLGNAAFDVTGDGVANAADVNEMVANLIGTWIGDSNGDGEFGTGDFVQVFTIGKFETGQAATWSEGDWNLDGQFNTSDFVAAFTEGGFERGPRGGVAAVPEPSGMVMIFVSLLGLLKLRRK
ncbi:MAG: hypothetical protein KDA87_26720, partial [Planctomycetales bacterium]|nr:hypothetical protein [Planctomycetales bacterium]